MEAEAVKAGNFCRSSKRAPLPPFLSNVENLNAMQFFVKYIINSYCLINQHLQRNLFKVVVHYQGQSPTQSI